MTLNLKNSRLFRNVIDVFYEAADFTNITKSAIEMLRRPRRSIVVSLPVRMADERIKTFWGYRVQHNQVLGPFKGGLRYHESVNLGDVSGLASLMTFKNSLLGLPLGGAKGGVQVNVSELSQGELKRLTQQFTIEMSPFIGPDKDIPAPDIGTDELTMAWIMDMYSKIHGFAQTGVVTGKPIEIGGSQGRTSATGLGVVFSMEKALSLFDKKFSDHPSVTIQGFGKVGAHAALESSKRGARVIAVSDVSGGIYSEKGLDIEDVIAYTKENKFVENYPQSQPISNEDLLCLQTDILAPCALDSVINNKNANKIHAKIIVEGANGPVTSLADKILREKDVFIVPDVLANGGGVIVSYFEWVQGISWFFWDIDRVRNSLRRIMFDAFDKSYRYSQEKKISMRIAAIAVAIVRLEKAMKLRGQIS